jgi:tetratricopeptide (TPR) repeat protein
MAKACLILPASAGDFDVIRQWSETAVSLDHPFPMWGKLTRGLAEYRQGQFEASVEWLRKAIGAGDLSVDAAGQSLLAMAQYRLNQTDQAKATFARALEALRKLPQLDSRDLGKYWDDVILAHLLMREAQALILGKVAGPADAADRR